MHFAFRKTGILISIGALILCCSCEEHQVGEYPPAQKEHVDAAASSEENAAASKQTEPSEQASPKPTPAEFFPQTSPSP
jgi:hypothetical protein